MSGPFAQFVRRMLRRRWTALAAIGMAFVSAVSLGAGLMGMVVVLGQILPRDSAVAGAAGKSLPDLARDLAAKLPAWIGPVPEAWFDALPTERYQAVVVTVVGIGVLALVGAAANFLHQWLALTLTTRTLADVRLAAFERILAVPLGRITGGDSADLISRTITDANMLNAGLQALMSKALAQLTKGAVSLALAFALSWRLSAVTLVVAPVLYVVIRKLAKRVRRASRGAMRSQAKLLHVASEALGAFRLVKVHGAESYELSRFGEHNERVMREQFRARVAKALATPLTELVTLVAVGGLALVAARLIIEGGLDLPTFIGTLTLLAAAGQSIKPLNSLVQDVQVASAAAERIMAVLDEPPEVAGQRGGDPAPRHAVELRFEGVRFTYPGAAQPALRGIDLVVPFGATIAFVGPNGCGKTTLLSLVPRLHAPDTGRVLLDRVDLATVDLASLRGQIGVVTQEVHLVRGTVAENIAYARPEASRDEIADAARRAHATAFVEALPRGLDTPIGDRGQTLSGGQRQRLAIARALLRDPTILILDVATSMIDADSEALIADAIDAFGAGRTCLVVAHRLSTVVHADAIVVMDEGRVVDSGRHEELLERCPLYRSLARHQLGSAPADTAARG